MNSDAERKSFEDYIEKLESRIKELEEAIDDLTDEVDSRDSEIAALNGKIDENLKRINRLPSLFEILDRYV